MGATVIDGELYWVVRFRPELLVGKVGVGLDIELLVDDDRNVREEDWDDSRKWVRIVRYVRYGNPNDPFYARVGALDDVTLGHGFIIDHYTNWYDEDYRRLGLHLSLASEAMGGGGFCSNLGRWEIVGARGWVAPLLSLSTPMLRRVRTGVTLVADIDPDSDMGTPDEIAIAGADIELPLLQGPPIRLYLYADHATIIHHGSGQTLGIGADLGRLLGISEIRTRLERRFLGDNFLPAYFDAFYGVDRYVESVAEPSESTVVRRKEDLLASIESGKAVFGELRGVFLGLITLSGSYQYTDDRPHSGLLHLEGELQGLKGLIELNGRIDKTGIEKGSEIFEKDDRTLLEGEIGYRLNPYSMLYVRYRRTFQKQENGTYEPIDVVTPRLVISVVF